LTASARQTSLSTDRIKKERWDNRRGTRQEETAMRRLWIALLAVFAFAPHAWGQGKDYPNRPVKIIVMTASGTSADQTARLLAEQYSSIFGQPFVVENRPGGDGVTGAMFVKGAPGDGHTILLGSNSPMSVNPVVKKDLPYDPLKDLKPVHGLFRAMNVLLVPGNSSFDTLADLLEAAKKKPLSMGTSFAGYRLDMEWLASMAGVKFNNIPYKGTSQMLTDLVGNHLDLGFTDRAVAGPLLKAGKVKGLGVGGEARYRDPPDVPTIRESGFPEYASHAWTAVFVHADTSDEIVERLAEATRKALASEPMQAYLKRIGGDTLALGPADMRKYHAAEIARYRRVAEAAGIRPE